MITINLVQDLADAMRAELAARGFDTSNIPADSVETMKAWFRMSRYKIVPQRRNVLRAQNLSTIGEDKGLAILEEKLRKGEDVNMHLSSRTTDPTKPDGLFDHWDITHLHLGKEIDARTGRIERTRNVLLCRIDENNVYFIKVVPHGREVEEPWYEQELVEIVHRNWPESIEFAQAKGVESVSPQWESKEDIKALRQANLVSMMTMQDGTVYMPPGGGTTGDATNVMDRLRIKRIIESARGAEECLRKEYGTIRENARTLGYHFKDEASSTLSVYYPNYGWWVMLETETGYGFRVQAIDRSL